MTEQGTLEIAMRLKTSREISGYKTGTEAANAMNVSVATYNSHENGHRGLTVTTAIQYAAFFRVSLDWLLLGKAFAESECRTTNRITDCQVRVISVGEIQLGVLEVESDQGFIPLVVNRNVAAMLVRELADFLVAQEIDEDKPAANDG